MAAALQLDVLDAELVLHLFSRVEARRVGEIDPEAEFHLPVAKRGVRGEGRGSG